MHKKTALVTGAAGDIGSEVARRLSCQGYHVVLVDIDEQGLGQVAEGLASSECWPVNLADRNALSEFLSKIESELPELHVAFVNAATICVGNVLAVSEEQIDLQLELNLRSAIHLIRVCSRKMVKAGEGHIISTVSMGGIVAMKGSATYSASKFGLRGFMTSIRDELSEYGVHVSGIYPSGVDTKMLRYEAENGGSALNFVSTPQTVDSVADAFEKALKSKRLEYYIPYSDSILGRFVSVFPWMIKWLYPMMESIGEKGRVKFLQRVRAS